MKKETLYYDGACSLCTTEIGHLRRLCDNNLQLVDVHQLKAEADERETLLRVLHFETESGERLTGLDATVAAWQHTRIGFLWRWLRWPVIKPMADWVYARWAEIRYRRLYASGAAETDPR